MSTKQGVIWLLISTGNCSRSPMLFTQILSCTLSSDTSATINFNIFFQVFLTVRSFIWWESYSGSWGNSNQLCSYSFRSFCTFPLFSQKFYELLSDILARCVSIRKIFPYLCDDTSSVMWNDALDSEASRKEIRKIVHFYH